jgi:phosphoribosylformylglycinamidine (FGAM) synthase-like enzyme
VIGGPGTHLGASQYLADILGREEGAPPPVDLAAEWRRGTLVRQLIGAARLTGVHDISSGGLGVALAEMAIAGGIGATVKVDGPAHAALFGEDQGRYVITVSQDRLEAVLEDIIDAGIDVQQIGTTGGTDLTVEGILTISVANLKKAHEDWFPTYMANA